MRAAYAHTWANQMSTLQGLCRCCQGTSCSARLVITGAKADRIRSIQVCSSERFVDVHLDVRRAKPGKHLFRLGGMHPVREHPQSSINPMRNSRIQQRVMRNINEQIDRLRSGMDLSFASGKPTTV